MALFTNHLGLNVAEEKLQLVKIVYKNEKFVLESIDEEFYEEPLLSELKESKFINILQNAYNEIDLRNPIASSNISISLPLNYFNFFEISVDKNITKKDINEYLSWELSKLLPEENKENYTFQKVELFTNNYNLAKRLLVFTIDKNILKRLHKFSVRNSHTLNYIDNAHIASTAILQMNNYSSSQLSIFIENKIVSFGLFSKGNFTFFKGKNYANLSEIPFALNAVIEEINNRELTKEKIDELFIAGNFTSKELINNIETSTNLKVNVVNPFETINIENELEQNKYITDQYNKFASAAGMAFRLIS